VRQASASEVARIQRDMQLAVETKQAVNDGEVVRPPPASPTQLEVVWMVAPSSTSDKDARSVGILWRGDRLVTAAGSKSIFAHDFFGASNLPPAGATQEVTGGVLWLNVMLASQATAVHQGWKISKEPSGAATSWDAWSKDRPNEGLHPWNERQAGIPAAKTRPVLPRRARVELEIERPVDRLRRTRLVELIDNQTTTLRVDDGNAVPVDPDAHVLLDGEWMKIVSVDGTRVVVERGQRGTTAVGHDKDTLVHYGLRMVTEATIAAHREDWQL
jgi:hypothetical protein